MEHLQPEDEGFSRPDGGGDVTGDGEGHDVSHLIVVVGGCRGLAEHLAALEVLIELMQGQVLPHTVLHDGPETEGDAQLVRNPGPPGLGALSVDGGRAPRFLELLLPIPGVV